MPSPAEMTNYVYHFYGTDDIFLTEAYYSIGTLLKKIDPATSRIIVFTDQPERLRALPVVCESIAGQIEEMKGPFGFGFRVKLCTILKCAAAYPGNIIYLDCDTIVHGPIEEMAAQIGNNQVFMYHQERLAERFPKFEGFQTQLPDGSTYRYSAESCMFNAGVIGMRREDAPLLNTALSICDSLMQQGIKYHICEQFAVSEAFRIAGRKILEAVPYVAHYYRTSAKRYMHAKIPEYAARWKKEPWQFEQPLPYSYPRVQWFKLKNRMFK